MCILYYFVRVLKKLKNMILYNYFQKISISLSCFYLQNPPEEVEVIEERLMYLDCSSGLMIFQTFSISSMVLKQLLSLATTKIIFITYSKDPPHNIKTQSSILYYYSNSILNTTKNSKNSQ